MLFAYHRLARAPVDVWIDRVIVEEYGGISPFEAYGEYAGIYQQYMFMLSRDESRHTSANPADSRPTAEQAHKKTELNGLLRLKP